jgi:hypothetical protein
VLCFLVLEYVALLASSLSLSLFSLSLSVLCAICPALPRPA